MPQTNWPDHLPEIGKPLADTANRDGVAERFPDPAVQQRVEGALALLDSSEPLRSDVELPLVQTAKQPHAQTLYRLPSGPGLGKILSWVLLYAMHDSTRVPRGQDLVSYCRLVNCAKASAGKRQGTSGAKIGKTQRKWAFSEAAVRLLRHHPAAQKYLARLEPKHGKGQALTVFAHKLARAVYALRKRDPVFDRQKFLNG